MPRSIFPWVLTVGTLTILVSGVSAPGHERSGVSRAVAQPTSSGDADGADVAVPEARETRAGYEIGFAARRADDPADHDALRDMPSDSALDDLAVGRYWHAALALRDEGMASSDPRNVLLLARAEAGWNNWPGVLELLEGAAWLDEVSGGEGLFLLGRAYEHAEAWSEAAERFDRYLEVSSVNAEERPAARARGLRSHWRAGEHRDAEARLAAFDGAPVVRSWLAADLVPDAVEKGDTASTRTLVALVTDPTAAAKVWRAEADAFLTAGDSARAAEVLADLLEEGSGIGSARAAEAGVDLGRLLLAEGDTAGARPLFERGLEEGRRSTRSRAAAALVDLGDLELEEHLRVAPILDRAGDGRRALDAYDRAQRQAERRGELLPDAARLARARLMATVRDRQDEALAEFRSLRETLSDRRLAARNLQIWARMRDRQGLPQHERTLRRWLVEDYPESAQAAEIVFMRGYDAESAGREEEALEHYRAVAENARTHSRAGQARMRVGQIHLGRGALEEAARTFEAYIEEFPDGRRWEEATYWAGRVRLELGDRAAGTEHLRRVLGQPTSYYAVMAADLLGEPYSVELSEGVEPEEPAWLSEGLDRLDMLVEADLRRGADAEVARLRDRARGDRAVTLRLAEALIERGRTIDGISLGWALRESGGWDRAVLRVTFPFPYRELVRREAEEWGVDPIMLAALIRQESAFKADIVSHAGAIGLMQVMPPTGEQLARRHGPVDFTSDVLSTPEINLHLGSAFLRDMTERYDGALPLVLSAYNAGPTRANRWRRYPEAADELRFTERIPFAETRGYVKNVRRNLGLYRVLYEQGED
ncbi:MAG: transglycosylase SLT domain-containing protein [Gemmatimonadota bacterium]|nr:transglycosylase SLT domain-containing protein [Gemmatimonadota bacterium]